MELIDTGFVKSALPLRPDNAHKGTMGTLLNVCGCYGMAGAGMLAAKAALRTGAGLVKWALPQSIYPVAASQIWECVYLPMAQTEAGALSAENISLILSAAEKSTALLMGCGLSVCADTRQIVTTLLKECSKPLVLDADALNCIADRPEVLKTAATVPVITPHPAEMGRLTGKSAAQINSDRQNTALSFAAEYGAVTVLKGAKTVVASPDGRVLTNPTGNSGMATGGSGDVLAGMVASLTAQGTEAFEAAAAAVYLHGLAGDLAAERFGKASMLPTDLIEFIPQAIKSIQ